MPFLTSALNWYHKKIGAYDKELWEKSVDQRILRGVCAIPKKRARIKTELIDVDLVRGSAFVKAKPQHSWIAASTTGVKRVLFLPFFYQWWKTQTNFLVIFLLIILYILQFIAMYLYFAADEKDFSDVPVSEVAIPTAMAFIIGVIHSQIVATFTGKNQKQIQRNRRKKFKTKHVQKTINYNRESKSSQDSCSEDQFDSLRTQTTNESCDEIIQHNNISPKNHSQSNSQSGRKLYKTGQHLRFSFEEQSKCDDSEIDSDDNKPIPITSSRDKNPAHIKKNILYDQTEANCNFSTHNASDPYSFSNSASHPNCETSHSSPSFHVSKHNDCSAKSTFMDSMNITAQKNHSINDWLDQSSQQQRPIGVAKQANHISEAKNNRNSSKACSVVNCRNSSHQDYKRRYSEGNAVFSKSKDFELDHRHSIDNIYMGKSDTDRNVFVKNRPTQTTNKSIYQLNNRVAGLPRPNSIKFSSAVKGFSSSCESGVDTTSPNTPSKPQTSDSEWPLVTNTDCNSDTTDCSSQCSSSNPSDLSPSENPFAWEIQEPSKKLSNDKSAEIDKGYIPRAVSCTIWEQNECKKASLTALDISTAIIQKVDSSSHSSEYLYIGVFFALTLSVLPSLYRLKNGDAHGIQDVATDVLTMAVPTSDDVIKITDGIVEVTLGLGWRVKLVSIILMVQRFALSLLYFFLLSVAEKSFKQRFLYAKHFCYLTSSRRAKRYDLPHFRLKKVKNIKIWLSIRSYMKKLGPQRSVDVIVSISFILEICIVSLLCIQLLKETGQFADKLFCWDLLFWTLALGLYLLRFMVIGSKINKKYQNLSVLLTEQINLYLHMEQKPHKKEELILANNVLKLAADLLKELESPFKISGLCANSYLYNITKVVVLSAFSAVLTDVLGFKLKLHKIKIQ